jgi:NADH-ubiquinone oxidoreductase chain 4
MVLAREYIFRLNYFSGFFLFVVTVLTVMLYCTFRRIGLLSFYIFFESRLIPTLFLILGWGYQPERVQAGIYLLFDTLLASLPLLVGIITQFNLCYPHPKPRFPFTVLGPLLPRPPPSAFWSMSFSLCSG